MIEINHKYGMFNSSQVYGYLEKMRKKIFWLILYTDENTNEKYRDVDVVSYQENLMRQLNGLNSLLLYPVEFVELFSILEAAYIELSKSQFNFKIYRKLVLDAGALIKNMKVGEANESV